MKISTRIIILLLLFITDFAFSQTVTQTVKGKVFDSETQTPLIGATVVVLDIYPLLGATTDLDGNYKISNVPIGRYNVKISYIGYEPTIVAEILVTSGKEVVISTGLKQSVTQMDEVTVKAYSRKDKPINTIFISLLLHI